MSNIEQHKYVRNLMEIAFTHGYNMALLNNTKMPYVEITDKSKKEADMYRERIEVNVAIVW